MLDLLIKIASLTTLVIMFNEKRHSQRITQKLPYNPASTSTHFKEDLRILEERDLMEMVEWEHLNMMNY